MSRQMRVERSDSGVGLVELLVAMGLLGIVMAAVGAVYVNTVDATRLAVTKTATTSDAKIAMEAMTRSLRVAIRPKGEPSAITSGTAAQIQFYASLNRGAGQTALRPTLVTYAFDATTNCLNETQVPASNNAGADAAARPFVWTSAGTTKCLIRTFAAPVLDYYATGSILQADQITAVPSLVVPAAGLGLAERRVVVSVQVSLNVQDPARRDINGVLARDRVTLSNVLVELNSGGS